MSYYTDYTIEVSNLKSEEQAALFIFKLGQETDYPFTETIVAVDDSFELKLTTSEAKFYEYEDVFSKMNRMFPDAIIDVYGEGEESGDIWKHRFKGGKDERVAAVMTFPDFTI